MGTLRWVEKIRNEVKEKAENMDEGDLKEWRETMRLKREVLEIKCGEINRILDEREREFLKCVAKQHEKKSNYL